MLLNMYIPKYTITPLTVYIEYTCQIRENKEKRIGIIVHRIN